LKYYSTSLTVQPLRGNVTTRIRRLREGKFDAIVLAHAGVKRLQIDTGDVVVFRIPFEYVLPAPAQGALAIQIRESEPELEAELQRLNHRETERAVSAERHFLQHFGGGCHIPLGALGVIDNDSIQLSGIVAATDGSVAIRESMTGSDPQDLGKELAQQIKDKGGETLL
jgi:hydroxymethylbilane synthase